MWVLIFFIFTIFKENYAEQGLQNGPVSVRLSVCLQTHRHITDAVIKRVGH